MIPEYGKSFCTNSSVGRLDSVTDFMTGKFEDENDG